MDWKMEYASPTLKLLQPLRYNAIQTCQSARECRRKVKSLQFYIPDLFNVFLLTAKYPLLLAKLLKNLGVTRTSVRWQECAMFDCISPIAGENATHLRQFPDLLIVLFSLRADLKKHALRCAAASVMSSRLVYSSLPEITMKATIHSCQSLTEENGSRH